MRRPGLPCPPVLALVLAGAAGLASGAQGPTESEIKSAYLYKICKFTEWPQRNDPGKPFVIAVLGSVRPGSEIRIPPDKKINGRAIQVRRIATVDEIGTAEVLFIGASEAPRLDSTLAFVRGRDILTFADSGHFGERGVMINFFTEAEAVKFEFNQEAAKRSTVQVNSQIVTIAACKVIK